MCLTSAQTFRGAITGSVTDATGAVISGASVKVVSVATSLDREGSTTATGDFGFQDLPPGNYTLTISRSGFQTLQVENIEVEVGRVSTVPVKLGVAQQATTVEVASTAVTLETDSAALNAVIPNRAVQAPDR